MTVVGQDMRLQELWRLGLSEPLIRLAAGECLHKAFKGVCLGPPFFSYNRAGAPAGPPLVPLWDRGDIVAGVWRNEDGLEFIEFSIEDPETFRRLAGSEQGFWGTRFDILYEGDVSLEDLRDATDQVGFCFLERHLASREEAEDGMSSFKAHQSWLRDLVEGIDRETAD